MRKNVVLITVDSLRYDRLGLAGHTPGPSPNLDDIASRGMSFSNYYVTGCPTQFSLTSLFSSTLPLDNGGCEYGVRYRDLTLAEVFRNNGYATLGFGGGVSLGPYLRLDRGFGAYFTMVDLQLVMKSFRHIYLRYLRNALKHRRIGMDDCFRILMEVIPEFFEYLSNFCGKSEKERQSGVLTRSPILHRWDFHGVRREVEEELRRFSSDPEEYAANMLMEEDYDSVLDFSRFENKEELKQIPREVSVGGKKFPQQTKVASAEYVLSHARRWMDKEDGKPLFVWIHLMDVHYHNFMSFDAQSEDVDTREELAKAGALYERIISAGNEYKGAVDYDLSVRYVDEKIGGLVKSLEQTGSLDNTLVVITSDHGNYSARWPVRGRYDTACFYEELYHTPLIFHGAGAPTRLENGLCSSIDVAPSILDIAGVAIPESFKGSSPIVGGFGDRERIIMEHTGNGPCDLSSKEANVCVYDGRYKVVRVGRSPDEDEAVWAVYDLREDPYERRNIASETMTKSAVAKLADAASGRAKEIYSQAGAVEQGAARTINPGRDERERRLRLAMYDELVRDMEKLSGENAELRAVCDERLEVIEKLDRALKERRGVVARFMAVARDLWRRPTGKI